MSAACLNSGGLCLLLTLMAHPLISPAVRGSMGGSGLSSGRSACANFWYRAFLGAPLSAVTVAASGFSRCDRLDFNQPLRPDKGFDDDRRRTRTCIAKVLCPRCAGRRDVLRAHQVGGNLHQISDPHTGVGKNGDDVPPASFCLGFDPPRYGAVGQNAYFAGDIEEPRTLGHLNGVTVRAERGGNGVWRVANIHGTRSLGLVGSPE